MKQVKDFLKRNDCDSALFLGQGEKDPNLFYLTGYKGIGLLAIFQNKKLQLIVPEPEYRILRVESGKYPNLEKIKIINSGNKSIFEKFLNLNNKTKNIALDFSSLKVNIFNGIKKKINPKRIVDISEFMHDLRAVKSKKEIAFIRKACKKTEEIIDFGIKKIHDYNTEAKLASFLRNLAESSGYKTSFDTIVASSSNTSKWHHTPTNKKISKGFLLIDFGLEYKGYCSDITRMFYVGDPTKKEIKAFEKVRSSFQECIKMIKPGTNLEDVQKNVQDFLGKNFVHGIGHGIGVEVHDSPLFRIGTKRKFEEGMVFAIEPALYFSGKFGVRIEDDIIVKKKGIEFLTRHSKNIEIIKDI